MSYVDYATTKKQMDVAKFMDEGNTSGEDIARRLGKDAGQVRRDIRLIKARAASKGYAPDQRINNPSAPGFTLDRYTQPVKTDDGITWYKYSADQEKREEMLHRYIEGLCKSIPPAKPTKSRRKNYHSDIMPAIFIGDAHIGMQAFASETRHSDFNVEIACEQLRDAFDYHVERMEPCENALLVDVGDLIHANDSANRTLKGTPLDTDQNQYKVMEAAGAVLSYAIGAMLTRAKRVTVVVAKGNHNTDPAMAIALILKARYHNEPRVDVLPNASFYQYIEYGNWLFGFHHGDKQKPETLGTSMARDMPAAWGRTTHRMWCTGHFHKDQRKTLPGVKHQVFGALPPPDSWHAGQGYLGDGEMEMITFRKAGGIHSSHTYNIPQPRFEPDVTL
ncbi:MAG TPA: hypothetical protein V6D20_02075 [Candidatus Obscuribacterales bacterium]